MSSIIKTFNTHILEFIDDVQQVFPEDKDIRRSKTLCETIKKSNPRLLIVGWKKYVTDNYKEKIYNHDISFFIEKDYTNDVEEDQKLMNIIERLRDPVRKMGKENQQKVMKYIENLTKLSELYDTT